MGAIFPLNNDDGTLFANAATAKSFSATVPANRVDELVNAATKAGCTLVSSGIVSEDILAAPIITDMRQLIRTQEVLEQINAFFAAAQQKIADDPTVEVVVGAPIDATIDTLDERFAAGAIRLQFQAPENGHICLTPGYGDWQLDVNVSGKGITDIAMLGDSGIPVVNMVFDDEPYTLMPKEETKQAA